MVNHNHKYGCQKCATRGIYFKKTFRMSFPHIDDVQRTDESFRERFQEEHHQQYSILEELPGLDMIKDFITSDSLHLLDLGLMKKTLTIWITDTKFEYKFSNADLNAINEKLSVCANILPSEIHRSVRNLKYLSDWKGVEFRSFLLYLGITVLKDILHESLYQHFLLLLCAVTICSSDTYKAYVSLAKTLFEHYINQFIELYGEDRISSNVHNLCHIADDVLRHGNLNSIFTYPFENSLGQIKLRIRNNNRPLAQISRRLTELAYVQKPIENSENTESCKLKYRREDGHFNEIEFFGGAIVLSSRKNSNKWFMTDDQTIVEMQYVSQINNQYFIFGEKIKNQNNFFSHSPFQSRFINIFVSNGEKIDPQIYNVKSIKCKMVHLPYKTDIVFLPLLHTLDEFKKFKEKCI